MIAKLDKRLELFKNVKVINERGGFTETPERIGFLWGALQPLSSSETLEHRKLDSTVNTKIFIRYRPDMSDEYFFRFDGVDYEIKSIIDPLNKKQLLEIEAVGGVGDV